MKSNELPSTFTRLAWSNLAAQSAEQIGLAATSIVAVLMLGAGVGAMARCARFPTGLSQIAQTAGSNGRSCIRQRPEPRRVRRIRKISLDTFLVMRSQA